jgi:hypothetical protein
MGEEFGPPADVVPGIVPVELILARTPQRAIGLTGIRAHPVGFGCTLHLRLREIIPVSRAISAPSTCSMRESIRRGEFADYYLRFGVRFADGLRSAPALLPRLRPT